MRKWICKSIWVCECWHNQPALALLLEALLAYGYCHCLSVCVCQLLLVRVITHYMFQLESSDVDDKMQNILLKVPWPSMSNFTSFQKFVYLHRFCVFEILWDVQKQSLLNCSTSHLAPHTFWFLYMHTDRSCHGPCNSLVTYICETIAVLPALDSAIWQWILQAAVGFLQIIRTSHTYILHYIIGNHLNNCKTAFICLYLLSPHTLWSGLFLARFTNRLCNGPWRELGDSAL